MEKIRFKSYRRRILAALKKNRFLGIDEPVSLIDGFSFLDLSERIMSSVEIGGERIPTILVLGSKSGRIYILALKVLLPDVEI